VSTVAIKQKISSSPPDEQPLTPTHQLTDEHIQPDIHEAAAEQDYTLAMSLGYVDCALG
jgi:hypothetical protein